MEFLFLGPLQVRDAGRRSRLVAHDNSRSAQILLTRANQVIGRDALIDELWGESPPETATNVLQGYISHLRKAIGSDVLQTRPPGYVAVIDSGTLDLHRFEELLATGSEALGRGDAAVAAPSLEPPSSCGAARHSPTSPMSRSPRRRSRGSRSCA